ncbi:MAG TPA: NAD(P)/FAD-dependent oxidoreductase [Candidatus Nanopelagicales bacterium]
MSDYDVIVVGGRVAGATTALLLARAGMRVAVVERSPVGTDTVSTHALMRAGVLQLSRWGVLGAVQAAGTPPVRRTLFHYPGQTVQVSIRPSPGVEALLAPRRTVLDPILLEAAQEAGADLWQRRTVVGLLHAEGRVVGVRLRTDAGDEAILRARLTIGADGLRSGVAAAVGAATQRQAEHASAVLYGYRAGLPTDAYEWAYAPGVAAGLIPTNDGLTCVFAGSTPADLREARRLGGPEALRRLFARAAPEHLDRFDASSPASPIRGWAGTRGFVRRSWGPGWALVGDAGLFRDPITTHGMTDALRDAELLADAVVVGMSGASAEGPALQEYQFRRDALSERLFRVTDEIASFRWDTAGIRDLLRSASSAMVDEVEFLEGRIGVRSLVGDEPATVG